jgi:DNA-binding transcriptional LysR family regulator
LNGPPLASPQGVELRHLRYFVAVADAGTFTRAAKRMFVAQPTLSQQIRRLEEMVGSPLLQRRREGLRLTRAGVALLEESRAILSLVEQGVSRARQAAGLGRPRLRVVLPPNLPAVLAVETASRLQRMAVAADVELAWVETSLDADFSLIRLRQADAGLGWLSPAGAAVAAPLDVITVGVFEPEVWIPSSHPAALRESIGIDELARMDVIHGPRRDNAGTYDAWLTVLQTIDPRFEFTDPPLRQSLPVTLAFAATGSRPTAVLTCPQHAIGTHRPIEPHRTTDTHHMVSVRLEQSPLAATAGLVWHGDLPRQLQQVLFDTADGITF